MKYVVILLLSVLANFAWAHSRWIVPSHTILSGDKAEYVSVDFSVSNDIFHPDNAYGGVSLKSLGKEASDGTKKPAKNPFARIMASTKMLVELPDGSTDTSTPIVNLGRKSASSYLLEQSGTYRISITQDPIYFVSYKDGSGRHKRLFGRLSDNQEKLAKIKGASDIAATKLVNRVETFVTRNGSTTEAIQPSKHGVSFDFRTHPNELFVGETVQAQLLLNGQAVEKGTEINIIRGGTRYRNDREKASILTGENGMVEMQFSKADLYLIEVEMEMDAKHKNYDKAMHTLYLTLEVNPE